MIFPCPSPFSQLKAKLDLLYASLNHLHDERYYTEAEVDTLIAGITGAIVGEIRMWPKSIWPPTDWFYCIGTEISRATYSALFDVIGTQFGIGDGSTTFNLPDFTGRFPIGADDVGPPYRPVGDTGGEEEHTLTIAEMPEHTIPLPARTDASTGGSSTRLTSAPTGYLQSGPVGSGNPHNNIPPYLAIYFIIYAGP